MTVLTIRRAGDPVLKARASEVKLNDIKSQFIQSLISDMFETMKQAQGVGLAAPQVGHSLRIMVYGFEKNLRYPNEGPVPLSAVINPVVKSIGDLKPSGMEGCLSLPTLRGPIKRYDRLHLEGLGVNGESIQKEVSGFEARIIQHELDHLDGTLIVERVHDFTRFGFTDELERFGHL